MKAADLIAGKGVRPAVLPSKEAMAELRTLLEYNDRHSGSRRVGAEAAVAMLNGYGWPGKSRADLDRVCVAALKRKSYGTP